MDIARGRAPFRISFAGGGTDIPPYCTEHGGQVTSTTIDKYVHVSISFTSEKITRVYYHDFNISSEFDANDRSLDGKNDLVKLALKNLDIVDPCDIHIHSDLPPRSGMGTSSSLVVALISALACSIGKRLSKYDIARMACKIEREDLKEAGGYQDQYAAAFGGFNFITFRSSILVTPLKIDPAYLNELNHRLVLCFTGKTRISAGIQSQVLENYGKVDFQQGMDALKRSAETIKTILEKGDIATIDDLGLQLHNAWISKQRLSDKISNPDIEKLYIHARNHGAIGGKLLGAGGGGFLLLFSKAMDRMHLVKELTMIGGEVIPFCFESGGAQGWLVPTLIE